MAAQHVRNPLASVIACADLVVEIADSAPPAKIRSFISRISLAARRINATITDLPDVNAIDSGERKLDLDPHDFTGIVARVVSSAGNAAAREQTSFDPLP